jgi:hypothetical protein
MIPETLSQHATTSSPRDLLGIGSVHLDRKLSATARLPQRSTVVESPSGKTAHPASLPTTYTRPPEGLTPLRSDQSAPRQGRPQLPPSSVTSPNLRPTIQSPPPPIRSGESSRASPTSTTGDHPFRPDIERNNTRVKIVDETAPVPDLRGPAENRLSDDVLTLADIPQLVEAGQALEQRRSVPHQMERPLISDLSALELVIVKHCALLALYKSPLRDQFDVDEILELVESKKGGFWKQLFKEKPKNLKKKGKLEESGSQQRLIYELKVSLGSPLNYWLKGTALIQPWVFRVSLFGYQASSMMLSLRCVRWVGRFYCCK